MLRTAPAAPVGEVVGDYEQARRVRVPGSGSPRRRLLAVIGTRGDYRQVGSEAHRLLAERRARDWAAQRRPDLLAEWPVAADPAQRAAAHRAIGSAQQASGHAAQLAGAR